MRWARQQDGFTLVEALVATLVLVVGALGTVSMLSAAGDQTSRTLGEESATGLAREVGEVARHVPFAAVQDPESAADAMAPLVPGSGTPAGGSWPVEREGRAFTVSLDACRVLVAGAGGCTTPVPGGDDATGGDTDAAVLADVLGLVGVDLSGGLPNALCGVFGPEFDLTVLALADVDADTCAQNGAQASLPSEAPRLARLTVTVAWDDRGRARHVAGTSLVPDPETLAAPR